MKQSEGSTLADALDFDVLFPTLPISSECAELDKRVTLDSLDVENVGVSTQAVAAKTKTVGSKNSNIETNSAPGLTKPKRPLTAYNLFFRAERAKLVGEQVSTNVDSRDQPRKKRLHRKTHGKIGFMELAKYIGKKWKNLDDNERSVYVKQAGEGLKKYRADMEKYRQAMHEKEVSDRAKQGGASVSDANAQQLLGKRKLMTQPWGLNVKQEMMNRNESVFSSEDASLSSKASRHYYALSKALEISEGGAPTQQAQNFSSVTKMESNIPPFGGPMGGPIGGHFGGFGGGPYMPTSSTGSLRDLENDLKHTLDSEVIMFLSNLG